MNAGRLNWTVDQIAMAHAEGDTAFTEFEETRAILNDRVAGSDGLELLARSAFAMFFHIAKPEAKRSPTGPEVFHLELLQALVLGASGQADEANDEVDAAGALDLVRRNAEAYRRLWFRKIGSDPEANRRAELIGILQGWTLAVRGPRHPHQTREFLEALSLSVAPTFRQAHACDADDVLKLIYSVHALLERRVEEYFGWVRSWFRKSSGIAMIEAFLVTTAPEDVQWIRDETLPHRYDRKVLRSFFLHLAQDRYRAIFTFDLADLPYRPADQDRDAAFQLFDSLAIGFGDLPGVDPRHFHLANPVRLKPFIRLADGRYFCCNPQSLLTSLAEIFQAICDRKPSTKKRSEKFRGEWLEQKLREILLRGFPSARIHRSVEWGTHSKGMEGGECDTVVLIDSTLLLFEAKSGKIDEPAKRGALNSLKGVLQNLVVDPSEQSERFASHLRSKSGIISLKSSDGVLEFDVDDVRSVVRVNVLLDTIGPLSAHWPKLQAAGLLPADRTMAPTMSIFELETVLEVLRLEVERCHYLSRRGELERDMSYTADELDLLADYLENQFNIAPDSHGERWLYGRSAVISQRYGRLDMRKLPVFEIRRTSYWGDLLHALECHKPKGWTRFGHRLLSIGYDGQKRFEKLLREGERQVGRNPDHFFTSAVTSVIEERRNTIAVGVGPRVGPEQFNSNLRHAVISAAEQGEAEDLLLVYRWWPRSGEPYDFIGTFRHATI